MNWYLSITFLFCLLFPQDREMPDAETFGLDLVRELITPQIRRRISVNGIHNQIKEKVLCYLGDSEASFLNECPIEDEAFEITAVRTEDQALLPPDSSASDDALKRCSAGSPVRCSDDSPKRCSENPTKRSSDDPPKRCVICYAEAASAKAAHRITKVRKSSKRCFLR